MGELPDGGRRPDGAIRLKRVYDPAAADDGLRVLVTRYWPRGVRREAVDESLKPLGTPADTLKAYQEKRIDHAEFACRYRTWLGGSPEAAAAVERLAALAPDRPLTLLTSFSDLDRSHVPVLRQVLAARALDRLCDQALQATRRFQTILIHSEGACGAVGRKDRIDGLRPVATAVAASGRELEIADVESEGRSFACHAGSYSLYGLPVAHCGSIVGAVVAESDQIGAFADAEREPIRDLARRGAPLLPHG